jgi:hypothetical protein
MRLPGHRIANGLLLLVIHSNKKRNNHSSG